MLKKIDIKNYENKQQLVWFGIINKLNELVEFCNDIGNARSFLERHEEQITKLNDAVDDIQKEREAEHFEIQEQIDELQMKVEPEKVNMDIDSPVVKMWKKKLDKIERENQAKIDRQIVEALITPADNSEKANCQENVQDKFAEQRKWVGKLCKFWDIDNDNLYYGPLTKIHDISPYCYECNHRVCYAHCEPVKDDIIYKGGDNE